jgi:hypothetical protein
MTKDSGLQELLEKRCKRSIAIILSVKEREADFYLPNDIAMKLRKVVMDQLNEFCSLASDVLDSATSEVVFNSLYLDKLDQIHRAVIKANDES